MGEWVKGLLAAIKGNQDLLALLCIGLVLVLALTNKVPLLDAISGAAFLGFLWVVFRYGMARLHAKEQLRDFRKDATVEAIAKLAKFAPKNDIKPIIESLLKELDDGK